MSEKAPSRKMSEWLKVMLEEVERRKRESEEACEERQRRSERPAEPQEK